jgi:hypothetical protein
MNTTTVYDCTIIEIPKVNNRSGNISIIEGLKNLPFEPVRVFYIYDIPAGEARGAHSHKVCHQFVIAASGSFEISLDDGINKKTVALNRPFYGLHIPPGIWAYECNFSSGAICLVLTSDKYNEDDYLRCYEDFIKMKHL